MRWPLACWNQYIAWKKHSWAQWIAVKGNWNFFLGIQSTDKLSINGIYPWIEGPAAGRTRLHAEMESYSIMSSKREVYKLQDSLSSSLSIHRPCFTIANFQTQIFQINTYETINTPVSTMPPRADMSFVDRSQSPEHGGDSPRPCPPGPPPSPANGSRAKYRHGLSWDSNFDACEFRAWLIMVHDTLLTLWNTQWTLFSQRWVHGCRILCGHWRLKSPSLARWSASAEGWLGEYAGLEDRDNGHLLLFAFGRKSWLWEYFFSFSLVTPLSSQAL